MADDKPAGWMRELAEEWAVSEDRTNVLQLIARACARQREIDAQAAEYEIERRPELYESVYVNATARRIAARIRKGWE